MFEIKVGFLVSYDYSYLYHSLPLVYKSADKIILAIDKKRVTWSGINFTIADSFFEWIKQIDTEKKITLYEDDFHIPELNTTECDTRERNMLAKQLGDGGWHIQVDSDEYFVDFEGFVDYLRSLESRARNESIHVFTRFITLFKSVKNGFLVVSGNTENIATATNKPDYYYIRNVQDITPVHSPFLVAHQSWARDPGEMEIKLKSWGHRNDFNVDSYFKLWQAIDEHNYKFMHNFHPLNPLFWQALQYIEAHDIQQLIDKIRTQYLLSAKRKKNSFKRLLYNLTPPIVGNLVKNSLGKNAQ